MNNERKAMFISAFIVQSSAFNDSLATALLDGLFEHPVVVPATVPLGACWYFLSHTPSVSAAC
jgi:MFS-type transporter involved in bile tolerance (Atg22 family)